MWLEEIFEPETSKYLVDDEWRLLILNGYKSHVTKEFMQLAYTKGIWCHYLVPHASHILQPLDLAVFSSLKRTFRSLVADNSEMDDYEPVKKARFLELFQKARNKAITPHNCASGFKAAGIELYNASKGLNSRFILATPVPRPTTPPTALTTPDSTSWDVTMTPLNYRYI